MAETEGFAIHFVSYISSHMLVDLFAKKASLKLFLYAQSPLGFESFSFIAKNKTLHILVKCFMAETEGFEPSRPLRTLTV